VWGQADAIYTLLALLIVVYILKRKYWISGIILGAALLIKIQTGFIAFAGIFALIERKKAFDWVTTLGASLGTFILLTLPFGIKLPFEWIIVQLIGTLTGYPYASVNAHNFFALFKGNWLPTSQPILFGLSADFWGIFIGYFIVVFMIFIYFWSKEDSKNYYIGMFAMAAIFMFIPGMHERYHYAVIIFSLMTYVYSKDRRFLYLFIGFSISVFINVYHILDVFVVGELSKVSPGNYYPIDPAKEPVLVINALANCFLFFYMVKVGVDVYIRNKFVLDNGIVYKTPLEVGKEKLKQLRRTLSESMKKKIESPRRFIILITGLISVIIPPLGIYPWLTGKKEMETYPEDRVVRAGNLLGRGIVILWIVVIATGLIVAPIVLSGLIKLPS
jgi:Gpi18-like mannosyltransferase